ncbi:MAG TPA: cytochrome c3 family protein [Verrucomicrobiales bacterium]|nr:cytochrome c3 family protein [Verrucomicrobiales bacterium]
MPNSPSRSRLLFRLPVYSTALLAIALASTSVWSIHRGISDARERNALENRLPVQGRDDNYVSSNTCRSCHPSEHASWHATYHRTMTQAALPGQVAGAFDGTTVNAGGLAYRVYQDGNAYWAEMPDPEEMMYVVQGGKPLALPDIPRVRRRVVMSTGSHHYQTYWVTGDARYGSLLQTLPLVYLLGEGRWIPREAAFMHTPGDSTRLITQWNHHCINCHSTGAIPGLHGEGSEARFETRVSELGIACEACHGPGKDHIEAHRQPFRRYAQRMGNEPDPTIVNPARLDHRKSSQVCGQCHGVFIREGDAAMRYAREGDPYRPGADLEESRYLIFHPGPDAPPERQEDLQRNPDFFRERWWDDGAILAAGREYTGLAVSGCFTRGEVSCLSCHSMHASDPNDQLRRDRPGSSACIQCHSEARYTSEVSSHTQHSATSAGSDCMNCHMPHTTYALFSAIRSHQIASPRVAAGAGFGAPNACNLCHLDKPLGWTSDQLSLRYGHPAVELTEEEETVSAALLWMLRGHAAQRVILAWHAGWEAAREASGEDWLPPFQAQLLTDPYGAVRYVAHKNLQRLPGFSGFDFDFLAPPAAREEAVVRAVQHWNDTRPADLSRNGDHLLIDPQHGLDELRIRELLRRRDDRPVDIKE